MNTMERYEVSDIVYQEEAWPPMPPAIDELIPYLSIDSLHYTIEQLRTRDPNSPHLETFEGELERSLMWADPDFVPYSLEDVIAEMSWDFFPDMSAEERRESIRDSAASLRAHRLSSQAYKYN